MKGEKLTKVQKEVLEAANCPQGLFQNDVNFWRWFKRLDNGMVVQIAGNATVSVLRCKGFLQWKSARVVHITPAGRTALKTGASE